MPDPEPGAEALAGTYESVSPPSAVICNEAPEPPIYLETAIASVPLTMMAGPVAPRHQRHQQFVFEPLPYPKLDRNCEHKEKKLYIQLH